MMKLFPYIMGILFISTAGIASPTFYSLEKKVEFKSDKPAFLFLDRSEGKDSLLIASFSMFGGDYGRSVSDLTAQINKDKVGPYRLDYDWNISFTWPNEVKRIPSSLFGSGLYSAAGGFLAPGKGNGHITLFDPLKDKKWVVTKPKSGWFYHTVAWHDMDNDGLLDIVTARATKNMWGSTDGEILWLKNPGTLGKEWEENFMMKGPDVFFKIVDLDNDGNIEIIATEFFSKKLSMLWKEDGVWNYKIIDETIGSAFDLQIVDINGDGKEDLLATNHEGDLNASVFAYEIPFHNLKFGEWKRHTLLTGIDTRQWGFFQASPGSAQAFYPNKLDKTGKPYIIVAGDGSQRAHLLRAVSSDSTNWEYKEEVVVDAGCTVGHIAIGDVDGDNFVELFIPAYDNNRIYVYSFKES